MSDKTHSNKALALLRQFPIASIAGVIAIICAILIFIRGDQLPALEKQLSKQQDQLELFEKNKRNAVNIQEHLDTAKSITQSIEERLLILSNTTENLQYWWALEASTGVTLEVPRDSGSPKLEDNGPDFGPIALNFTITGPYDNVIDFLNRLAHDRFIIKYNGIQLNPIPSQGATHVKATVGMQALGKP